MTVGLEECGFERNQNINLMEQGNHVNLFNVRCIQVQLIIIVAINYLKFGFNGFTKRKKIGLERNML